MGGIAGTRRFLDRIWTLVSEFMTSNDESGPDVDKSELMATTHRTIKKVTQDLETMDFNTAIAAMMSFVNDLYRIKASENIYGPKSWQFALETLVQLLAPFAPHIAEEMWHDLGHEESVHTSHWPKWDESLVKEETITIAVQVNGKVRSEVVLPSDVNEEYAIKSAQEDGKIAELIKDKEIKKAIYVPGRLVSLVVE